MPTIDHCPGCPYREFGPAVGPRGDPASRIVLVGEAPGREEIKTGRPFVGPAGRVLSEALAEAGLSPGDLFITNAVACMPHPVHPWVKAIDACRGRLVRDIEAHPRAVVVALGLTAVRAVTGGRRFRMMDSRGVTLATVWGPVLPTLHPARVLRRPAERPMLVDDLKHARRIAWRSWRSDAALRADARLAAGLLGRLARKPLVWLSAGVLLVGTLLGIAAMVHGITG